MGRVLSGMAADDPDIKVVAGFDINTQRLDSYPVFDEPGNFTGFADVVVDFSNPSALDGLLDYCLENKAPLVLCTTGYSPGQIEKIGRASGQIPLFRSANMSIGINVLSELVQRACAVLGNDFDIEIVERHHNRKVDAPSGTAMMLADAAKSALPDDTVYVFERHSRRAPREAREIGISAVRGGSVVGDHEVIFMGPQEVIEVKHSAMSRDVFAAGAISAAKYLAGVKTPGLYDMNSLLSF